MKIQIENLKALIKGVELIPYQRALVLTEWNNLLKYIKDLEQINKRINGVSALEQLIKSDSVYTLLRYGSKSPSSSGVDDCDDSDYMDLYDICCELRKH